MTWPAGGANTETAARNVTSCIIPLFLCSGHESTGQERLVWPPLTTSSPLTRNNGAANRQPHGDARNAPRPLLGAVIP